MSEAPRSIPAVERAARAEAVCAGSAAWLAQERVFRWIPFILVEGTFLLVIVIPFLLTIYISLLRWRANRPFEQAYLSGFRQLRERAERRAASGPRSAARFISPASPSHSNCSSASCWRCWCTSVTHGRRIYITIFLIPMMVVPVVAGYNFSMIYLDSGPLNQLLAPFVEPFGIDPRIRWLSDPIAAQWAIILADVWQWTSLTFLIFLSGFSSLPQQLINAARVMGANRRQIFFWVELPLLKPAIIIAVVIRSMEALEAVRSGRAADLRRARALRRKRSPTICGSRSGSSTNSASARPRRFCCCSFSRS